MKFAFVARYRPVWPTRMMCRLLDVSTSGFYEWLGRAPSLRSVANAGLLVRIRESFALSGRTYGSPRIWKDMIVAGESCGKNRVARLMRLAQINAQPKPRRKPTDVGLRPEHSIAPNVLERDFAASGPNRKWAADFTYIWTGEGWLFVAVVVDLYSRRVVGWSMQPTMSAQLVLDALMMALWRPRQAGRTAAPLRPGQPIYQRGLPAPALRRRHHLQHESARRLLGQLGGRKFLCLAQEGAGVSQDLPDARHSTC